MKPDPPHSVPTTRTPEELLEFLSRHRRRSAASKARSRSRARRGRMVALLLGIVTALSLAGVNVLIWANVIHVNVSHSQPRSAR